MKKLTLLGVAVALAAFLLPAARANDTRTLVTFLGPDVTVPLRVPAPPAPEPTLVVVYDDDVIVALFAPVGSDVPVYAEIYVVHLGRTVAVIWDDRGVRREAVDAGLLHGGAASGLLIILPLPQQASI